MKIIDDIEMIDLALHTGNMIIISDTHAGYEEALNRKGILVPRFQFNETIKRLEKILKKTKKLDYIIINGDVKHEFGKISDTEWRHTIKLLDFLLGYCREIVLIKGNHDEILDPIAKKRNVRIVDNLIIGDIIITHGDKLIDIPKTIKTIIIGHEHPAISIKEGERIETFKCFLLGKYKGKNLIVQPSFNLVTEGSDILREKVLSPFLEQKLDDFNAYVVSSSDILDFGKLKNLRFVQLSQ